MGCGGPAIADGGPTLHLSLREPPAPAHTALGWGFQAKAGHRVPQAAATILAWVLTDSPGGTVRMEVSSEASYLSHPLSSPSSSSVSLLPLLRDIFPGCGKGPLSLPVYTRHWVYTHQPSLSQGHPQSPLLLEWGEGDGRERGLRTSQGLGR